MDKYDGIYKAEASSERVVYVRRSRTRGGSGFGGVLMRTLTAAIIVGACFGAKYLGQPFADKAVQAVREAVCYDATDQADKDGLLETWLRTDDKR